MRRNNKKLKCVLFIVVLLSMMAIASTPVHAQQQAVAVWPYAVAHFKAHFKSNFHAVFLPIEVFFSRAPSAAAGWAGTAIRNALNTFGGFFHIGNIGNTFASYVSWIKNNPFSVWVVSTSSAIGNFISKILPIISTQANAVASTKLIAAILVGISAAVGYVSVIKGSEKTTLVDRTAFMAACVLVLISIIAMINSDESTASGSMIFIILVNIVYLGGVFLTSVFRGFAGKTTSEEESDDNKKKGSKVEKVFGAVFGAIGAVIAFLWRVILFILSLIWTVITNLPWKLIIKVLIGLIVVMAVFSAIQTVVDVTPVIIHNVAQYLGNTLHAFEQQVLSLFPVWFQNMIMAFLRGLNPRNPPLPTIAAVTICNHPFGALTIDAACSQFNSAKAQAQALKALETSCTDVSTIEGRITLINNVFGGCPQAQQGS